MVRRPEALEYTNVCLRFNLKEYRILEIDLDHINKNNRSDFSVQEICGIVVSLLSGLTLDPSDSKNYDSANCDYYVKNFIYEEKRFKLIFCICSDRPRSIGVITIYRKRGAYESI